MGAANMPALIELSHDGPVATLTLNRPDKMNALNLAMWRELAGGLREVSAQEGVRCLVLQGAGAHFAAGADLAEFAALRATAADAHAYGAVMLEALWGLRDLPHPTIAAISGNCLGAGLELAAMCDLRLATAEARFGVPIQRVGITMPYPELAALVALLGRATMLEILLEGRIHDSAWALSRGVVNRVVPAAEHATALADMTGRIVAGSPLSHRNHKQFILRCQAGGPLSEAELRAGYAAVESADYREGLAAFLEKRRPAFSGR
jgi:enoyl-CoA hydratase/carnithine racemase